MNIKSSFKVFMAICSTFVLTSQIHSQIQYDPLTDLGGRAVNPAFTRVYDIPPERLYYIDSKFKAMGLTPNHEYTYNYRKLYLVGYKEFYYIFWICDKTKDAKCYSDRNAGSQNIAIVNFKKSEYILTSRVNDLSVNVCINKSSGISCSIVSNKDYPLIYRQSDFLGDAGDAIFVYKWAHISPNSNEIIRKCIRQNSYDNSKTYSILENDGSGWRPTGRTETDYDMGISIKNICQSKIVIFTRSNLTGSSTEILGPGESFTTIPFNDDIGLFVLTEVPPKFWS